MIIVLITATLIILNINTYPILTDYLIVCWFNSMLAHIKVCQAAVAEQLDRNETLS